MILISAKTFKGIKVIEDSPLMKIPAFSVPTAGLEGAKKYLEALDPTIEEDVDYRITDVGLQPWEIGLTDAPSSNLIQQEDKP